MMKFPRWLSWVVMIGLGWILFVGNTRNHEAMTPPPEPNTAPAPAAPQQYKEIEALLDGERWKKAIYPDYENPNDACKGAPPAEGQLGNYALVLREGSGEGAVCGENVTLSIVRRNNDGSAANPVTLSHVLGQHKGLDMLLVGMRTDEQRLLIVNLPAAVKPLPAKTQLLLEVTRTAPAAAAN